MNYNIVSEAHELSEHFIQTQIDRAPEQLKRLGRYLTIVLDEDQFKTAERMLLGIAEILNKKEKEEN